MMGGLSPIKHRETSQKDGATMPPESFGDGKTQNYFNNLEIDKRTFDGGDDVSNIAEAQDLLN